MENKTLKDLTILELKALCYDEIGRSEQILNNIKIINQEIMSRQELPVVGKTPEKEEPDPQGL